MFFTANTNNDSSVNENFNDPNYCTEAEIASLKAEGYNVEEYLQNIVCQEFSQLNESELKEFIQSERCESILSSLVEGVLPVDEASMIGKTSRVQLSKNDDLERRIKMACTQIAKDKNDRLFYLWDKGNKMSADAEEQMRKKYESQGRRLAMAGQKTYLKSHRIAQSFRG